VSPATVPGHASTISQKGTGHEQRTEQQERLQKEAGQNKAGKEAGKKGEAAGEIDEGIRLSGAGTSIVALRSSEHFMLNRMDPLEA
jgi:hypothetical protein